MTLEELKHLAQHHRWHQYRLNTTRINVLNSMGFIWNKPEFLWNKMYEELVAFKQKSGHCNVVIKSGKLGRWCDAQRQEYKLKLLSEPRINKLNSVGFVWGQHSENWNKMYEEIIAFKRNNNHCNVPPKMKPHYMWCHTQRGKYKTKKFSQERIDKLNSIGFVWKDDRWDEMYNKLLDFTQKHGKNSVPRREGKLGSWCQTQRETYKLEKLSQGRIDKLNAIKFEWGHDRKWEMMYDELVKFKQKFGCFPTQISGSLGHWCSKQRARYKRLSRYRIDKLNALGFQWSFT